MFERKMINVAATIDQSHTIINRNDGEITPSSQTTLEPARLTNPKMFVN
jgi:hypothetical protein